VAYPRVAPSSTFVCTKPTGYTGQAVSGAYGGNGVHNCIKFAAWIGVKASGKNIAAGGGWPGAWVTRAGGVKRTPRRGAYLINTTERHVAIVTKVTSNYIYLMDDNASGYTRSYRISRSTRFNTSTFGFLYYNEAKIAKYLDGKKVGL